MLIDEEDHRFNRPSSSAVAKYADASRRISLACRFSRSRAFIFSVISLGRPNREPPSTSVFFTHSLRVYTAQPILAAIEEIGDDREEYSP